MLRMVMVPFDEIASTTAGAAENGNDAFLVATADSDGECASAQVSSSSGVHAVSATDNTTSP